MHMREMRACATCLGYRGKQRLVDLAACITAIEHSTSPGRPKQHSLNAHHTAELTDTTGTVHR